MEPANVDPGAGLIITAGPDPGLEVGVGVGVDVGLDGAVAVGVGVGLTRGVGVGLGAIVGVGLTAGVGVGDGLGVGVGELNPKPNMDLVGTATAKSTMRARLLQRLELSLELLMSERDKSQVVRLRGLIIGYNNFLRLWRWNQSGEASPSRAGK